MRTFYIIVALLFIGALLGLSACQTSAPARKSAKLATAGLNLPERTALAPVGYEAMQIDVSRGDDIGSFYYVPRSCAAIYHDATWEGERGTVSNPRAKLTVDNALWEAGLNAPGGSDTLFQNQRKEEERPTHLLGARIESMNLDICRGIDGQSWDGTQRGDGTVTITWELYSVFEERVVFSKRVTGYGEVRQKVLPSEFFLLVFAEAMADSVPELVSDPELVKALKRDLQPQASETPGASMTIKSPPLFKRPAIEQIDRIRESVVVVRSGRGHGSGFFIAPDLVVTNHHVVGGSREAQVILLDGRSARATILASHKKRDVALLQVEGLEGQPLPVRQTPLKLTEDVLAIGAPLDEALSGTVTRGIVSNFRLNQHGLPDIQADADIHGGNSGGALLDSQENLVGVSYSGILGSALKTSVGINFFIPILDGLKHLGVTIQ